MKPRILRSVQSFGIALIISISWIDAFPSMGAVHSAIQGQLDTVLDKTGLWQGSWQLFAPEVDSRNSRIVAYAILEDGKVVTLQSPNWRTLSPIARYLRFRESEYFDGVSQKGNRAAADALASYLARQAQQQFNQPVRYLQLGERWSAIAHPVKHGFVPSSVFLPLTQYRVLTEWGARRWYRQLVERPCSGSGAISFSRKSPRRSSR